MKNHKGAKMKKTAMFGDSILRGLYWDDKASKYKIWENKYIKEIRQHGGVELKNYAQIGSTVERGRDLFHKVMDRGTECQIIMLEYGGNDCDHDWQAIAAAPDEIHAPKTPMPVFTQVYSEVIGKCREMGMTPILINLPPIDSQKYFNWFTKGLENQVILHWLGDINRIYRYHEWYSLTIAKLARDFSCPLVDLRSVFLSQPDLDSLMGPDGLHPTPAGYTLIWEEIKLFLGAFCSQKTQVS